MRQSPEVGYDEYGRSGVTLGGAFTGTVVGLTSAAVLTIWATAILDAQGVALRKAIRGEFTITSAGLAVGFVTVLFVSFLWAGYTAGRMGAGAGVANGSLVGVFTLLLIAAAALVMLFGISAETIDLPYGIGELPLDANFTVEGLGALAALVVALFGGAIWGSVIGVRWHWTSEDPYARHQITGTDSFSDLRGRP
ncbi:MAG: hypothetical protein ACT4OM_04225 [Actinomycetota bacterium]